MRDGSEHEQGDKREQGDESEHKERGDISEHGDESEHEQGDRSEQGDESEHEERGDDRGPSTTPADPYLGGQGQGYSEGGHAGSPRVQGTGYSEGGHARSVSVEKRQHVTFSDAKGTGYRDAAAPGDGGQGTGCRAAAATPGDGVHGTGYRATAATPGDGGRPPPSEVLGTGAQGSRGTRRPTPYEVLRVAADASAEDIERAARKRFRQLGKELNEAQDAVRSRCTHNGGGGGSASPAASPDRRRDALVHSKPWVPTGKNLLATGKNDVLARGRQR